MSDELARKRILVVEGDFFAAAELQDLLEREGCTVAGPVASTDGAVTCILEGAPDAAILDVALNAEDTEPLLAELAVAGVPVLYVAASGGHVHAPDRAADRSATTSFDVTELRSRLSSSLGKGNLHAAAVAGQ